MTAALTIHEAAGATGWSPRMLRYVEQLGLVSAPRSAGGYRLYGPAQLARLRSLRELLDRFGLELGEVGFARRLRDERELAEALDRWFDTGPRQVPDPAGRPEAVRLPDPADPGPGSDAAWLAFEQAKHEQLLAARPRTPTPPPGGRP